MSLSAGVVSVFEENDKSIQTTFMQGNLIRTENSKEDSIIIFDVTADKMYLILPQKKLYTKVDVDEYFFFMERIVSAFKKQLMLSPATQLTFQQNEEEKARLIEQSFLQKEEVQRVGNIQAQGYGVFNETKRIGSLWTSQNLRDKINQEVNITKVNRFFERVSNLAFSLNKSSESDVVMHFEKELQKKVDVVKSTLYNEKGKVIEQRRLLKVTVRPLDKSFFSIEKGYRHIDIKTLFSGMMQNTQSLK